MKTKVLRPMLLLLSGVFSYLIISDPDLSKSQQVMSSIFYNNEGAASVDLLTNAICAARINADVDAFFKYYYYKGATPNLVRNLKNEMKIYWEGKQIFDGKPITSIRVLSGDELNSRELKAQLELGLSNGRNLVWVIKPTHWFVLKTEWPNGGSGESFPLFEINNQWYIASVRYAE